MTLYAYTTDGQTVTTTATLPPTGARRLDTGAWVTPPADGWTADLLAACGWLPVVEVPRPADTATTTSDPAPVALVAGVPTQQWTVRPWTAEELAAQAATAAWEAQQAVDRAILDATAALMAGAHTDGEAWVQPTGAHDAVPLDRTVTLDGKTWRSLHPANVWRPDPSSRYWEVVSGEPGPEPWSAGTYYRIDNKVTYNGQTWNCTHEHLGQVGWEPGAAGMHAVWKLI